MKTQLLLALGGVLAVHSVQAFSDTASVWNAAACTIENESQCDGQNWTFSTCCKDPTYSCQWDPKQNVKRCMKTATSTTTSSTGGNPSSNQSPSDQPDRYPDISFVLDLVTIIKRELKNQLSNIEADIIDEAIKREVGELKAEISTAISREISTLKMEVQNEMMEFQTNYLPAIVEGVNNLATAVSQEVNQLQSAFSDLAQAEIMSVENVVQQAIVDIEGNIVSRTGQQTASVKSDLITAIGALQTSMDKQLVEIKTLLQNVAKDEAQLLAFVNSRSQEAAP